MWLRLPDYAPVKDRRSLFFYALFRGSGLEKEAFCERNNCGLTIKNFKEEPEMKKLPALFAMALVLTMVMPPAARAAEAPVSSVCYPTSITRSEDGTEVRKVYDLAQGDDPSGIPRSDFEQEGFRYTLVDLLKQELPENESRQHTETVSVPSKNKDMESVLALLPQTKEFVTVDGLAGYGSSTSSYVKGYTGTGPTQGAAVNATVSSIDVGGFKGSTLKVGERTPLIIYPNTPQDVITSSHPAILAVENVMGHWTVLAKSPGTAIITVTAANGQTGSMAFTVIPGDPTPPADLNANMEIRQEIIRLINQVRRENGVAELPVNDALMNAAQITSSKLYTTHHNREECETAMACGYPYGFANNLTVFSGSASANIAR